MDMTYASAAQYLRGQDDFLILTHKNPDGDTVGCAVALCLALRDLGKRAQILENPGFTARYAPYLEGLCTEKPSSPACIVAVDIADEKLFPKPALAYCSQVAFAVDHHASHRNYAERALVDAGAAACGELVYRLILALGVRLRPQLAQALYIAISTDTTCFLNANTTPETHRRHGGRFGQHQRLGPRGGGRGSGHFDPRALRRPQQAVHALLQRGGCS